MRTYVPSLGGSALSEIGADSDREAQLLVCGSFPDKNLTVTEGDLDDIVQSFSVDTVPIKLEHVSTVLDPFGLVKALWRDGTRLMASIGFDPAAAPLLAQRPVKSLSVGLDRDSTTSKLSLAEVSLVLRPRLATATLLNESDPRVNENDPNSRRIAELTAKLAKQEVDSAIIALRRAGKMIPSIEPLARALLGASGDSARIAMADGSSANIAETALLLLSSLPRLVNFSETGPGAGGGNPRGGDPFEAPPMTPEQAAYCKDILKVDPEKVRAAMTEQARRGRNRT